MKKQETDVSNCVQIVLLCSDLKLNTVGKQLLPNVMSCNVYLIAFIPLQ